MITADYGFELDEPLVHVTEDHKIIRTCVEKVLLLRHQIMEIFETWSTIGLLSPETSDRNTIATRMNTKKMELEQTMQTFQHLTQQQIFEKLEAGRTYKSGTTSDVQSSLAYRNIKHTDQLDHMTDSMAMNRVYAHTRTATFMLSEGIMASFPLLSQQLMAWNRDFSLTRLSRDSTFTYPSSLSSILDLLLQDLTYYSRILTITKIYHPIKGYLSGLHITWNHIMKMTLGLDGNAEGEKAFRITSVGVGAWDEKVDEWHISPRHVFYHIHAYAICAIHYFTMIFDPHHMHTTSSTAQLQSLLERVKPMNIDDELPTITSTSPYTLPTLPPVLMILREFIIWFSSYENTFSAVCTGCSRHLFHDRDTSSILPTVLRTYQHRKPYHPQCYPAKLHVDPHTTKIGHVPHPPSISTNIPNIPKSNPNIMNVQEPPRTQTPVTGLMTPATTYPTPVPTSSYAPAAPGVPPSNTLPPPGYTPTPQPSYTPTNVPPTGYQTPSNATPQGNYTPNPTSSHVPMMMSPHM